MKGIRCFHQRAMQLWHDCCQTMFLEMREDSDCVMVSIDVKDAFLTVKRQTATVVNCTLADGEVQPYGLGRVLPGQRDGWQFAMA